MGFDNVVRHLVLLPKQTFIATFVSRHVTTTNFSEPPLELSAGPRTGSSEFKYSKYNLYLSQKLASSCIRYSNRCRSIVWKEEIVVSMEIGHEKTLVQQRDYDMQVKLTETVIV